MASDYIMTTDCQIQITMNGPETYPTLSAPIPLVGSSKDFKVSQKSVCLEGDETPQMLLSPQTYQSPSFPDVPGTGTVTIKIESSNKTQKTQNGGKPMLITGQSFSVEFDVVVPATLIDKVTGVPIPDPVVKKTGSAKFININTKAKAG